MFGTGTWVFCLYCFIKGICTKKKKKREWWLLFLFYPENEFHLPLLQSAINIATWSKSLGLSFSKLLNEKVELDPKLECSWETPSSVCIFQSSTPGRADSVVLKWKLGIFHFQLPIGESNADGPWTMLWEYWCDDLQWVPILILLPIVCDCIKMSVRC